MASPLGKRQTIDQAVQLLDLFGQRYAKAIRTKLTCSVQCVFGQCHSAFVEIQKRLQEGDMHYSQITHPQTFQVLKNYSEAVNHLDSFHQFKQCSYGLLPFPQKMIVTYANLDLNELKQCEQMRERGFHLLVEALSQGADKLFSLDEELVVTRLYFRGGALVHKGKIVFFSEMVHLWGLC